MADRAAKSLEELALAAEAARRAAEDGIAVPITVDAKDLAKKLAVAITAGQTYAKAHPIVVKLDIDPSNLPSQLALIKRQFQRIGLADFLDFNLNLGQIDSQLRLLKRKIAQYGISDMLSFNISGSSIDKQLVMLRDKIAKAGISDFIGVNLDEASLAAQLNKVREALKKAGLSGVLGIALDSGDLSEVVTQAKAYFNSHPLIMPLSFDTSPAAARRAVAAARAIFKANPITIPLTFDLSASAVMRAVRDVRAAFAAAGSIKLPLSFDLSAAAVRKVVTQARAALAAFPINMKVALTISAAEVARLVTAARALLKSNPIAIPITLRVSQAELMRVATLIRTYFRANPISIPVQIGTFGTFGTASAAAALARLTKALNSNGQAANAAGFGWGFFNQKIQLFAGLLGKGLIGSIRAWELALHIALDTIILVIAAAAALTATLAAMVPAAQDVWNHLNAVNTVNSALGTNIPPLTAKFDALTSAMAPRVIEAYGGALTILNRNTGVLGQTVQFMSKLFDTWIAKIEIWSSKQNVLGGILKAGAGYVQQLGQFIGVMGQAITNLIKDSPNTIHFLLEFFIDAAKILDVITKLPHGIGELVLGFLALRTYGGLFVTFVAKPLVLALISLGKAIALTGILGNTLFQAAGGVKAAGTAILGLSLVSWAWIAVAVAGLTYLTIKALGASQGVKDFISTMNTNLEALPASQAIPQIGIDLGKLNAKIGQANNTIKSLQPADVGAKFAKLGHDITSLNFGGILDGYHALLSLTSAANNFITTTQRHSAISAYRDEINKLTKEYGNLLRGVTDTMDIDNKLSVSFDRLGAHVHSTRTEAYTYIQALALMDLAGVSASDSVAVMDAKVQNLITGYQNMGVAGKILLGAVNAVTLQTEIQSSKITQLTGAWTAFIGLVSGGETALVTFAQGMQTLGTDAGVAGASIDGLNTQSLTLRQTFEGQITSAQNLFNALANQASVLGNGAAATADLTRAGKDLIATLLPTAATSQQAFAQVDALAQVAGGPATTSFKVLSKWVGNIKHPMDDLNTVTGNLAVGSANLATDVQNLANAIQTTLTAAMDQAIFLATGGQKVFNNFANAILAPNASFKTLQPTAKAMATQLLQTTHNTKQAQDQFDTFATRLGLTKPEADALWASVLKGAQDMVNTHGARAQLAADIQAVIDKSPFAKGDLLSLTDAIHKHGATADSYKGQRAQLIKDLEQSGLNAQTATGLVDGLIRKLAGIPAKKAVQLVESGMGSFSIRQIVQASQGPGGSGNPLGGGLQQGGRIPGYGGGDKIPIMAERGETVVPKELTPVVAPIMKAYGVPGFAAGGIIPGGPMIGVPPFFPGAPMIPAPPPSPHHYRHPALHARDVLKRQIARLRAEQMKYRAHHAGQGSPGIEASLQSDYGQLWTVLDALKDFGEAMAKRKGRIFPGFPMIPGPAPKPGPGTVFPGFPMIPGPGPLPVTHQQHPALHSRDVLKREIAQLRTDQAKYRAHHQGRSSAALASTLAAREGQLWTVLDALKDFGEAMAKRKGTIYPGYPMIPGPSKPKPQILIPGGPMRMAAGGLVTELGNTSVVTGDYAVTQDAAFQQQVTSAMENTMTASLKSAIKAAAQAFLASQITGYGSGVTAWAPYALQAMAMLGIPSGDLPIVLSQMQTESGGNIFAVNLTDSNARAGVPSTGLMQVIGPTYAAYGAPRMGYPPPVANGVSEQPLANIYAGLNYALSRYGSNWVNVLGHGHGYALGGLVGNPVTGLNPRLFDSGGWLMPGLNLALNTTGKPERVPPPGESGPSMENVESLLYAILQGIGGLTAASSADAHGAAMAAALDGMAHAAGVAGMTSTGMAGQW